MTHYSPTPYHVPVLLSESIDALDVHQGGIYVDVTYGGGGHSDEVLRRLQGSGRLFAFDQDADAIARGLQRHPQAAADEARQGEVLTLVRANFRHLWQWMRYYGIESVDGILADLGVSSHHFDTAERGFSFRSDAPLDMRMNQQSALTAADVVNTYSEHQLTTLFRLYGELRNAHRLASALVRERSKAPIATTRQLAEVAEQQLRAERQKKEMAKVFQALRIEVNGEMEALTTMLAAAARLLRPGGRLVVITYHSLEDRLVKNFLRAGNVEGNVETDFYGHRHAPFDTQRGKVVTPSDDEQQHNSRSRSAKLRVGVNNEDRAS